MALLHGTSGPRISDICNGNHLFVRSGERTPGKPWRNSYRRHTSDYAGSGWMKFSVWQRENSDTYSKQIIDIYLGVTNNADNT